MINLSKEIIDTFESEVRDQILPPSGHNYDEVREIRNAMIQRHPALIFPMCRSRSRSKSKARVLQASASYASDGAYVNFMTEEETDEVAPLRRPDQKTV